MTASRPAGPLGPPDAGRDGAALRGRRPDLRRAGRAGDPAGPGARRARGRARATGSPCSRSTASRSSRRTSPAPRLGAIVVPVNFRLVADEVAYVLADSGAAALVVDARAGRRRGEGTRAAPGCRRSLVDRRRTPRPRRESYEDALAAAATDAAGHRRRRGRARLHHVHLRHDGPAQGRGAHPPQPADARFSQLATLGGDPRRRPVVPAGRAACSTSPGWPAGCRRCCIGGRIVITRPAAFDPVATLDLIEREQVTSIFFVPASGQAVCRGARHRRPRPVAACAGSPGAPRRRRPRCCAR